MANVPVTPNSILGIDIGSVSVHIVQLDTEGKILRRFCQFHRGNIGGTFSEAGKIFDLSQINAIACTSSSICLNKKLIRHYNAQVSIMAAAQYFYTNALSVLHIGA
jgi:activator of 2-hydroxyglutaryl-CoA dehydratase